jgi:hypothetical protein
MQKKRLVSILLWVGTGVFLVLSLVYFAKWREHPVATDPEYVSVSYSIVFLAVALVLILIWFFTREKEEEISITKGS